MIIKSTYKSQILDYVIIAFSVVFLLISLFDIFSGITLIHAVLLPNILFLTVSIVSCLSLVLPNFNGERFSRIFIGAVLILPGLLYLFTGLKGIFIEDEVKYSFQVFPILRLVAGLILLKLSLFYTKHRKSKRIKDLGFFIAGLGIYMSVYIITLGINVIFSASDEALPIWEFILKLVLSVLITITGFILKGKKIEYKPDLNLVLALLIIYLLF